MASLRRLRAFSSPGITCLSLCACMIGCERAQKPAVSDAEIVAEIMRLDSIWLGAYVTADAEAVRPILADDFIGQLGAEIADKGDILERVAASRDVEAMPLDAIAVNVYGGVAVVHAQRRRVTRLGDDRSESRFAYTDVYQLRNGRWVCITGQSASIPEG